MIGSCVTFQPRPLDPARAAARFDSRSLADPALRSFVEVSLGHTLTEWPPAAWDFELLTLAALYFHPSLEVARAHWATMLASVQSAGGSPNPSLGFTPGYTSNPVAGVSPWFPLLAIDVPIETAGKRQLRIDGAEHLADAARHEIATIAWRVRTSLRTALITFSQAEERETILRRLAELQETLSLRLEQRFAAGLVSSYELSIARLAAQKTRLEAGEAQRERREARVVVAEAVGIPVRALDAVTLTPPAPAATTVELPTAELRGQALTSRPDVLRALADYAAAQSALQLEIAKQYPDIHLGTGYQFDQGDHKWSLGLTIDLPLFNQNQGPIAEAMARRLEVAARFEEVQARAVAEIELAITAFENAQTRRATLDTISDAQAKQGAAAAAQLAAGATDQLELLTVKVEVAQGMLARNDGERRALLALGALEDAIQSPISTWRALEHALIPSPQGDRP